MAAAAQKKDVDDARSTRRTDRPTRNEPTQRTDWPATSDRKELGFDVRKLLDQVLRVVALKLGQVQQPELRAFASNRQNAGVVTAPHRIGRHRDGDATVGPANVDGQQQLLLGARAKRTRASKQSDQKKKKE